MITLNGRDLRKALHAEFKEEGIAYSVETIRGRGYELPHLEVYVTHTESYALYERLAAFVLDWFHEHRYELKVKAPRMYFQSRGMRFPWPTRLPDVRITDVEVVLGAFAL